MWVIVTVGGAGKLFGASARVEIATGVLMEMCGWEPQTARSRLLAAAVSVDLPVTTVADSILALRLEHPRRTTSANRGKRR